jgi:putative DNA primase/helicase
MTADELEDRLRILSRTEFALQRKQIAKDTGVRASDLDTIYAGFHPKRGSPESAVVAEESWPEPVPGASLLEGVLQSLERFVVADEGALLAAALWIVAAAAHEAFNVFPMPLITAPTRECGKTRLLDVMARLVPRPMPSGSATPAVLYRSTESRPTILLDELDQWVEKDPELIGFLNNGWQPNIPFRRCNKESHEIEEFPCWCPKALAMIGLPKNDALVSRCIVIPMRRKLKGETVERFRHRKGYPELGDLRRMAARWAEDHLDTLRAFEVEGDLEGLDGRELDNWEVIYSVASTAGGEWPARVRKAIRGMRHEDDDLSIELLRDLRELLSTESEGDAAHTEDLLSYLNGLEDRPWATIRKNDKPADGNWLRRRLARFKVKPDKRAIRISGVEKRGYYLTPLREVFKRYLPERDAVEVSQPSRRPNGSGDDSKNANTAGTYASDSERDTRDTWDGSNQPSPGIVSDPAEEVEPW